MGKYKPEYFINRELSWLRFNSRVLSEASNKNHPLLEQLKYIAIYGTNLDEFYMIRVAGLLEMNRQGINVTTSDGFTTQEQLTKIRDYIHGEIKEVEKRYEEIVLALAKENLHIKNYSSLTPAQKKRAKEYFMDQIFPVIIPIAVDPTHPFPHLNNLSFAMVLKLREDTTEERRFGIVRIPRVLPRFLEVEDGLFVPIESLVFHNIKELFPGFSPITHMAFRVTRNADLVIAEAEADDFLEELEEGLKSRRKGQLVRLEVSGHDDQDLFDFFKTYLRVEDSDIYKLNMPLNMSSYWEIVGAKQFSNLRYQPYTPKSLEPFQNASNMFSVLDKEDVVVTLPYESFNPIEKLVAQAAKDPDVLSIRMTLYRVGSNSPIVRSLIEAAEDGKMVTAIVELKARFDEENNLRWAKALERAGAHVIYGVVGLKIHAKIAHIIKKTDNGLKHYVHLATGNYNPSTAKIYTDISFFTSNSQIGADAVKFFHTITGFSKDAPLSALNMSPTQIKPKIIELIEKEKELGENGEIIVKVNSLVDDDVIEALYDASSVGVKINLIVRGICCLRPGVEGVSENIKVISIVGKYLEHPRCFYFKNSTPQVFFSSADWMPRNLVKRMELMTPIFDEKISKSIIMQLRLQLADNVQSKILGNDGEYTKVINDLTSIDSQAIMEKIVSSLAKDGKHANEIAEIIERDYLTNG